MSTATHVETCAECGGNCDPECGRHPAGCLYSGVTCGEWAIAPKCTLEHEDVARAKAIEFMKSLRPEGLRVLRRR